ncbi:MAG: hypothetical protein DRR16_28615 [Candidatus Parabeggiatoa sp. nov. 3]|nr:MAG: hypothetical protein DRR00_30190 [Gammaproteobacteria bacterium]RKZ77990.1 MAG: hypothetical protein DRR16_28615 [Gammaproteobacteria bacterium]HEW97858.1 hypothetical protein [Beggiatoa sp.]
MNINSVFSVSLASLAFKTILINRGTEEKIDSKNNHSKRHSWYGCWQKLITDFHDFLAIVSRSET